MTASANLHAVALSVGRAPRKGVYSAAKAVKTVARAEGGGVHIWRKRSKSRRTVKLRAYDNVRVDGDRVRVRIQGVPVGPWVWRNTGTDSHLVGNYRRGRRKPVYLKGPGFAHPVRAPIAHPGTSGAGAWRKVVKRAQVIVPREIRNEVRKAVNR